MSTAHLQPKIALGTDFLTAFSRLPQPQQKKVREFCDKFTRDPTNPGTNYETIQGARDPNLRSVRIDQAYRGIVLKPDAGDVYILLWVDKHDPAYDWARRHQCRIHPETGSLQVLTVEEGTVGVGTVTAKAGAAPISAGRLLEAFTDAELATHGVPHDFLPAVRALDTERDLDGLAPRLPGEAADLLYALAAGFTLEEARQELGRKADVAIAADDFATAVTTEDAQRSFVLVSDAVEMEKILAAPLEKWRVFLHPSQRRLKEMHANGPVRVLGGAGTGKTVVAMHRAQWLAGHVCRVDQQILFTTFTKNLAADIRANLQKICSHEELARIEVINLDAWVARFLRKRDYRYRIVYGLEQANETHWEHACQSLEPGADVTSSFLRSEWEQVVQAQGIETLQDYYRAPRAGQGKRLGRLQRKRVWPVFEEYRALLAAHGLRETGDAMRDARHIIEQEKIVLPYRSVIVDEGQDFSAEAFRLLRSLVSPVIAEQGDDLFIVGDAHQRIYGRRVALSRCGIEIRGRSRRLRINYRTTEETRAWATALLQGCAIDDLDGGVDDGRGYRSLFHGVPPLVRECPGFEDEVKVITAHLHELLGDADTVQENICLVAPSRKLVTQFRSALDEAGFTTHLLDQGESDDREKKGVRVATMHRVKGLEFDHMIVAGLSRASLPLASDGEDDAERIERNRCLLHVAATRARRSVLVTGSPKLPEGVNSPVTPPRPNVACQP